MPLFAVQAFRNEPYILLPLPFTAGHLHDIVLTATRPFVQVFSAAPFTFIHIPLVGLLDAPLQRYCWTISFLISLLVYNRLAHDHFCGLLDTVVHSCPIVTCHS